jgi:hypothetical protein
MISYIDGGKDTKKISNNQEKKTRIWYFSKCVLLFRVQIRTPAAALPIAPNKAVSTATATFAIVFQCRIILSSFLF